MVSAKYDSGTLPDPRTIRAEVRMGRLWALAEEAAVSRIKSPGDGEPPGPMIHVVRRRAIYCD